MPRDSRGPAAQGGLLESLGNLAHSVLGAVQTRLELFSNELEEQGARVARIALTWALAAFCLGLAVVLGAVLLVVLFWDSNRIAVLASLTAVFAAGGVALLLAGRSLVKSRPTALAGTLQEIERDRQVLRERARNART